MFEFLDINTTQVTPKSKADTEEPALEVITHKEYGNAAAGRAFYGYFTSEDGKGNVAACGHLSWNGTCFQKIRMMPNGINKKLINTIRGTIFFRSKACFFKTSEEVINWVKMMNEAGLYIELKGIYKNFLDYMNQEKNSIILSHITRQEGQVSTRLSSQTEEYIYAFDFPLSAYEDKYYGPYHSLCLIRYIFYRDFATKYVPSMMKMLELYPEMDMLEKFLWAEYLCISTDGYYDDDYRLFIAKTFGIPITKEYYIKNQMYLSGTDSLGLVFGKPNHYNRSTGSFIEEELRTNIVINSPKKTDIDSELLKQMVYRSYVVPLNNSNTFANCSKISKAILDGKIDDAKAIMIKIHKTEYKDVLPWTPESEEDYTEIVEYVDIKKALIDAKFNMEAYYQSFCITNDINKSRQGYGPYKDLLKGLTRFEIENNCLICKNVYNVTEDKAKPMLKVYFTYASITAVNNFFIECKKQLTQK